MALRDLNIDIHIETISSKYNLHAMFIEGHFVEVFYT